MASVTLTQADAGTAVQVRPGDTVIVSLEENPTTGYRWTLGSLEQPIVRVLSAEYTPAGGGIGGGGMRTFTLEAVDAGTGQLMFKLWREWAGDRSIIQRYDATIEVR